jgi:hypothetical protein
MPEGKKSKAPSPPPIYSSRILKATALISDTKTLLSHWDVDQELQENIRRGLRDNIFGKASRSRVEDMLNIFRQRYLKEATVVRALVSLVRSRFPAVSLERLLYFHSALADRLLYDTVTQILVPLRSSGVSEINLMQIQATIAKWVTEGKTSRPWSESTIDRVQCNLVAALRDFGVLEGRSTKKIVSIYLPVDAFAYIAFYLSTQQPSGSKMIDLPEWGLFFLGADSVEQLLFEAHQRGYLQYHVAGSVARLTFPARTLEEYADVIAPR